MSSSLQSEVIDRYDFPLPTTNHKPPPMDKPSAELAIHKSMVPVQTGADGNCLFRAAPLYVFGNEDYHRELSTNHSGDGKSRGQLYMRCISQQWLTRC